MPEKSPRKPDRPTAKKKWERPRMKTGHLFESNSLSCGKNGPTIEQCSMNPTQS